MSDVLLFHLSENSPFDETRPSLVIPESSPKHPVAYFKNLGCLSLANWMAATHSIAVVGEHAIFTFPRDRWVEAECCHRHKHRLYEWSLTVSLDPIISIKIWDQREAM